MHNSAAWLSRLILSRQVSAAIGPAISCKAGLATHVTLTVNFSSTFDASFLESARS